MKAKNSLMGVLCPKFKLRTCTCYFQFALFLSFLCATTINSTGQSKRTLYGIILSATDNSPLVGATARTQNMSTGVQTTESGNFTLFTNETTGKIIVSHVGYKTAQFSFNSTTKNPITITLEPDVNTLEQVTVSTGFQTLPKERANGSFSVVNNELLNRSVSANVLSRLNGVTSGLLFDKTTGNAQGIAIRGKSTIFANSQPLIILDNFPYEGDLNNINPNDVESITVLKDAAAASIWGTRAGNGVIVITTIRGRYNVPVSVSFNSNVNITERPDLFYEKKISSADFIEAERFLFEKGKYNSIINDGLTAITPAVDVLLKARNGTITSIDRDKQLTNLATFDVRNDLRKYYYRKSINQQYAVNLSGGSDKQQYYISGGFDNNTASLVGNAYDRISLNANNTYSLLNHRLEINTGIAYVSSNRDNNAARAQFGTSALYPYARLADELGNALPLDRYRNGFLGTKANGALLDWNYRPLDELRAVNNTTKLTDYQVSLGLKYKIIPSLNVDVKYRYGTGNTIDRDHDSQNMYDVRNLINSYTQINPVTGAVTRPIPLGDILSLNTSTYTAKNLRGQLNYNMISHRDHQLTAILGAEIGEVLNRSNAYTMYGYDPSRETSLPVDFTGFYNNYLTGSSSIIPSGLALTRLTNKTVSTFGNAAYTYLGRYTLSGSARNDGSNLFGVRTNSRWTPLWSVGAGWNIDKERFFNIEAISTFKLRTTYGYNGNIDKKVTAFLTTRTLGTNRYGAIYSNILNPPNPDLTWERIGQLNIELDFAMRNRVLSGTVDYFRKTGSDMIGDALLAPSSGFASYRGNTAKIKGEGVDVTINARLLSRKLIWNATVLFSAARTIIKDYKTLALSNRDFISGSIPAKGKDLFGVYAYRWGGLDALTGEPMGYLNGVISKDYTKISTGLNLADLVYKGSATPTKFGSVLNSFSYNRFILSFNLIYKFGYYFRRESINYSLLFTGSSGTGHSDYAVRWKKPGDEVFTNVPAMIYPANAGRETFYSSSETLVEKGDHLRLQDVQLSYSLNKSSLPNLPFKSLKVFAYANNLGVLWAANSAGLDPDVLEYPQPRSIALGLKIGF
jgi:TonB-linked SusC/RagA family outer membrane protein